MAKPRRLFAGALLAAVALSPPPARAETDQGGNQLDIITKLQDSSQVTVWRIDRPNVKHPVMTYPTIGFMPGDKVRVAAGGCVQTGGWGRTWKRYVNPSGPKADRLYRGLIGLPGVPRVGNTENSDSGLSRLQDFGLDPVEHVIPSPLPKDVNPNQLFLTLGYEDDGYGDNGYYAHDDGTDDQCKNVDAAFLIVSVGHDGALPPDPSKFIGIEPNNFRCQAAWAFKNFDTATLSWSSFANAFSLDVWDYIDPLTYVTYLGARSTLASGGNCEGMSLLSLVGEDQFVVNDLKEAFWANYKAQANSLPAPSVASDINVAHWKQLSTYFLHNWLSSVWNHPQTNAEAIERDLTRPDNAYNYGLVSIANGFTGHVLVPLAVSHSGNQTLIEVYDPNRPCGSIPDKTKYPKIVITGDSWSYDMGGDGVWTGSNGPTGGMAYIPYAGEDGWSDLGTNLSGVVQVIFGGNAEVQQVSSADGRKLFVEGKPGVLDMSASGLAHDVVRLPSYAASTEPKRPRADGPRFTLDRALKLTQEQTAAQTKMENEYGGDYDGAKEIYLINNAKLTDVTFQLAGKNAGRPLRAMIGQTGDFFEVKTASMSAAALHPAVTVHSVANFSAGVTVADSQGAAQKLTISRGVLSRTSKTLHIETSEEVAATGAIRAQLASDKSLELLSPSGVGQAKIKGEILNETGALSEQAERTATFGALKK